MLPRCAPAEVQSELKKTYVSAAFWDDNLGRDNDNIYFISFFITTIIIMECVAVDFPRGECLTTTSTERKKKSNAKRVGAPTVINYTNYQNIFSINKFFRLPRGPSSSVGVKSHWTEMKQLYIRQHHRRWQWTRWGQARKKKCVPKLLDHRSIASTTRGKWDDNGQIPARLEWQSKIMTDLTWISVKFTSSNNLKFNVAGLWLPKQGTDSS